MAGTFQAWQQKLRTILSRTEASYELPQGEVLTATGTTDGDLQELFSYGWTPEETARTITETLGLR
ncbi:MAG: hypothetical protein MK116_00405 [Phycisphaerales bacterium]|nr:hypothetical protein [Phycisphaerales bacterium]